MIRPIGADGCLNGGCGENGGTGCEQNHNQPGQNRTVAASRLVCLGREKA